MGVVLIIKRFNAVHGYGMRLSVYSHQCVGVFAFIQDDLGDKSKSVQVQALTSELLFHISDGRSISLHKLTNSILSRHSPDRTTFPGYSSRRDAANYNLAFQGRQMHPDSLKFLLSWTNHHPAKRKISKPLVYDQVSSLGSPFALYDPVTVINPDAPKVD